MQNYNNVILKKAKEYMSSSQVKSIKAHNMDYWLQYNIPGGTSITIDHITSIILYCDLSKYSSRFSATFRKLQQFETIHSVRKRNSEYWFQSKLLKETVTYYGTDGDMKHDGEPGPFYSGVNCVLPIPQFEIRLFAPTSTSKQMEVSINFATSNGMIITFNNKEFPTDHLSFFDCSWISRFPDEDERLFAGGALPITIQCIKMMKTNHSYTEALTALCFFDSIFNGVSFAKGSTKLNLNIIDDLLLNEGIVCSKDLDSLSTQQVSTYIELIDNGYSESEALKAINISHQQLNNASSDPYIVSIFNGYIKRQKKISLQMVTISNMLRDLANRTSTKIFSMLIEGSWMQSYDINSIPQDHIPDRVNLLSSNIFKIFPYPSKHIIVRTRGTKKAAYPFNVIFFLENIWASSNWKQIEIGCDMLFSEDESWIFRLWRLRSSEIREAYAKHHLKIEYRESAQMFDNKMTSNYKRHSLIIRRA